MGTTAKIELNERQRAILRGVVEEFVATRQPVGSRTLVERTELDVSPSTVRNELAELETLGLLTHPHTSAGRIPTERGYRYYADRLLERLDPQPGGFPLDLTTARTEVDSALQATTEMLSELTRLLALVSAPPLGTATVRHVEVLLLQPNVVMVVVITSTGSVTKRVFRFAEAVDPGLANWGDPVPQRPGRRPRARKPHAAPPPRRARARPRGKPPSSQRCARSSTRRWPPRSRASTSAARPACWRTCHGDELESYQRLLEVLEKRAALLDLLSQTLDPRRPFVRVGPEIEHPALRELSLVGASYGLTNRTLGAVTLLGPVRMDYDKAIRSVRAAAHELSRFVEEIYDDN